MNQFPYENLMDNEFEDMVILICKQILGIGCKTFSIGKDGAKDSWFTGRAEKFPSQSAPWQGDFIIQAKHTKELNASCSDNDFSVNQSSVLKKEINRLKEIKKENSFDNYLIFTNRKLSGGAHTNINSLLRSAIGIDNVDIIGREQLDTYLTDYPFIANQLGLYKFAAPLRFYEKDLREVIIVFSEQLVSISQVLVNYITNFDLISKEKKNVANNLGKDYFNFMLTHSNKYFNDIENFLTDPKNDKYTKMYSNTVSDLQAKVLIERDRFSEFQVVIEHLIDFVVENNSDKLRDIRGIVRVFIHFMYFNCDIGITK